MKKIILIFIALNFLSCKKEKKQDALFIPLKHETKSEPIKNEILFLDGTLMKISKNINFIDSKKIDSIHILKKELKAKYQYCGKSSLNHNLIDSIKSLDKNSKAKLKKINTAHNVINNSNIFYLNGYSSIECFEENDSIRIYVNLLKFYSNESIYNLPIIDRLEKIKD